MSAIANLQPSRMPISPDLAKKLNVNPQEWRVLVDQVFPSAQTVEAVAMAMEYCRARNLDIFKKPVHIVPMWSSQKKRMVETVWPGIAEIRTTASRTGEYAGIDAVEFGPNITRKFTGQDKQGNALEKEVTFPEWASVVVYRLIGGVRCPYHAKVYWEEAYATAGKSELPNEMWCKRPRGQLDKCVEAAALRKAFPEELGNTYAAEEMEGRTIDAHEAIKDITPPPPPPAPSQAQVPPAPPAIEQAEEVEEIEPLPDNIEEVVNDICERLAVAESMDLLNEIWDQEAQGLFDSLPDEMQDALEEAKERGRTHVANRMMPMV